MFGGLLRVLGIAIGAGGAVGVVLGLTVLADDPSSGGSVSAATATIYACPGASEVGTLQGGDRVLITGRSGDWLAVRNVRGGLERVFVAAAAVTADADLTALPEASCDLAGSVALDASPTTVAPTPIPPPQGDTTTTTLPPPPVDTTAATTTTAPAPSVGPVSANPNEIWEKFVGFPNTCPTNGITTISAAVSAAAGTQSVTMSWSSSIGGGSKPMASGGGVYTASLGPFDAADNDGVPQDESITVIVTVTVIDTLGRSASNSGNVTLNDCTFA